MQLSNLGVIAAWMHPEAWDQYYPAVEQRLQRSRIHLCQILIFCIAFKIKTDIWN